MKILFIEPCYVNFGGYFRSYNICTNLAKKGIKVDLLVASKNDFSLTIKKTFLLKNLSQFELPRFNLHFFFNGRIFRGVIAFLFGLFGKYDIIHACVPVQLESNIPAFFLKLLGKKVVIDWDDYWEGSTIYGEYQIMKKYVAFCEKKAPRFFENIVVVSDYLFGLAVNRGAKKTLKLINGVNTSQFQVHNNEIAFEKLKLDKKYKYLISFGNTYTNKRAHILFKVFSYIHKIDSNYKLLFNHDPNIFIREQNIKIDRDTLENIKNIGYIQQKDLGYYLGASEASIFLMSSLDQERANFPIRIGSFLNGESIIIVNDINSEVNNTLKKYNCSIMDKNLEQLAKKSVSILNNKNLILKYKKNTIKAKNALSWDILIVKLIDYYKEILKS